MSADDLQNFGFWLIAKAREDANRERAAGAGRELGTREDVCKYLHISKPTFHSLVNRGLIQPTKVGRRTLCDMAEIRRLVDAGQLGRYKHTKTR